MGEALETYLDTDLSGIGWQCIAATSNIDLSFGDSFIRIEKSLCICTTSVDQISGKRLLLLIVKLVVPDTPRLNVDGDDLIFGVSVSHSRLGGNCTRQRIALPQIANGFPLEQSLCVHLRTTSIISQIRTGPVLSCWGVVLCIGVAGNCVVLAFAVATLGSLPVS